MSDVLKKLKQAQRGWKDVETPSSGGGNTSLPDGRYKVEIVTAELKEDKNGGTGILWKFEALDGEHQGETQVKWSGLLDADGDLLPEDRVKWTKKDLAILLGEPVEDLTELADLLGDLLGMTTEIGVKTNSEGYTNTYINSIAKRNGKAKADDEDEDEPEEKDEDEDEDDSPKAKKSKHDDDADEDEDEDSKPAKKGKKSSAEDEVARLLNRKRK